MNPRALTEADVAYWTTATGHQVVPCTFTGPGEVDAGVEPCQGLITRDTMGNDFGPVARVPWQVDEIDVARLAKGGTLWLSTWGGLPMHLLEVGEP